MFIRVRLVSAVAIFVLATSPGLSSAQSFQAALDRYLTQELGAPKSAGHGRPVLPTIEDWSAGHPGETVEVYGQNAPNTEHPNPRDLQNKKLQGRWCLRSTTEISVAEGVRVRRVALFYQPLVEWISDKPLPPLPTESGAALRQHGCRLARIVSEFDLAPGINPRDFAESVATKLPGSRSDEPGRFIVDSSRNDFWQPVYSFDGGGFYHLFMHNFADHPAALLEWRANSVDYGEPSPKAISPRAGQPWLPLRAAMLARLPQAPTLEMLSLLVPQAGGLSEQPPFHCDKQLVPPLRRWLALAAAGAPQQHAAALLLADAVADRLSECQELSDEGGNRSAEAEKALASDYDDLMKNLKQMGIETDQSARPGPEDYTGNLIAKVRKLAPTGIVNELSWIATLNQRCRWSSIDGSNCEGLIKSGENFLSRFPADEWTPSVHLILAEAYSITGADTSEDHNSDPESARKAAEHLRAWFATSTNERDRALVWQEIWGIEAGLGPQLMLPMQLRR